MRTPQGLKQPHGVNARNAGPLTKLGQNYIAWSAKSTDRNPATVPKIPKCQDGMPRDDSRKATRLSASVLRTRPARHRGSAGARRRSEDRRSGSQARHPGSHAVRPEGQVRRHGRIGAEPSKLVFAGLPAGQYPVGVPAKGPEGGLSESDLTKTTGQGIRVFRPRTLVHPACGSIGAGRSQMPILYNEIKSLIVAAATLRCLAPVPGRPTAAAAGPTAPCDMPLDRRPHRPS